MMSLKHFIVLLCMHLLVIACSSEFEKEPLSDELNVDLIKDESISVSQDTTAEEKAADESRGNTKNENFLNGVSPDAWIQKNTELNFDLYEIITVDNQNEDDYELLLLVSSSKARHPNELISVYSYHPSHDRLELLEDDLFGPKLTEARYEGLVSSLLDYSGKWNGYITQGDFSGNEKTEIVFFSGGNWPRMLVYEYKDDRFVQTFSRELNNLLLIEEISVEEPGIFSIVENEPDGEKITVFRWDNQDHRYKQVDQYLHVE